MLQVDVGRERRLAQARLENVHARALVGQRDVDELVEPAGAQHRRVDNVGPVGGADDEDGLLGAHAIHLGEDLVDDAVSRTAGVAARRAARARDRVELVEKEDARRRAARLVKQLAHVGLRLAEPHGEQLGALDRDEIGRALVGNRLGEKRLAAAGRAVKEHALGRAHAELFEFFGEVDRVLHDLLKLALDALEAADVVPRHIGHLDHRLAQRRRVGRAERRAEVLLRDGHRVEDLGVDLIVVEVYHVHLLADALHRRLGAELRNVGADVAVRLLGKLLQVDVVAQLHVLRVDAQHLEAAVLVGHANVNLAVEASEAAERAVDRVWPVGRADDDDVRACLEAVHQRQQLRNDAALNLALRLLALGRDGVDLVDEDDGGRVLLCLLERLAQVRLRLACELGHDFRPVDKEEKGASLVGNGSRDEGLARAGRAVHQDAARWLHANRLEELGVAQWQLNQLSDVAELLAHAANVVVADVVHALLVLTLNRLALAVDDRVRRNDAVLIRISLHNLEFDGAHAAANEEEVILANWAVRLEEVRLQEDIEQVARHTLDCVINR
mmetsp:Transcript_7662/g.16937  ORF Transcript_7662/g.16937 Transcript_7662/m.16937 type:complete len:557 (+) Transcript_7662:788-2458(+)